MGAWEEGRTRWYKIISWLVSCLAGQVTFSPFFTAFDSLPCWLSTLSVLYSVLCTYTKYSVQEILLFYYSILFYYFINIFYCIFFSEISSILMLIVQEWYAGGFPRIVGGGTNSPTWHVFFWIHPCSILVWRRSGVLYQSSILHPLCTIYSRVHPVQSTLEWSMH